MKRRRSEQERALIERARGLLPAGVRGVTADPERAILVRRARGARLWDESGNEYVDHLLGSGSIVLGHAHPAVNAAVREALDRGSSYLLACDLAVRLAEEIVDAVPCAERVSFHSSGSEATFFAMRLARAFTGRDRILKFEGGFHGMSDYALQSTQWTARPGGAPRPAPDSAGIPAAVAGTVVTAPFNDLERTGEIIERFSENLAAVIVEPMQRTIPPRPGFLAGLRDLCRRHGILLIFDEIVTGFRLAYGGAQERYGVVPDLCAVGKTLSAGFPLSAVCGRADVMALADPSITPRERHVKLTGTYSGNPVSCAAALATLAELRRPGVYQRLETSGRRLMEGMTAVFADAGIAVQITGEPAAFEVWFTDREILDLAAMRTADVSRQSRFAALLFDQGVLKGHEKFFVSLAHGEEELERTLAAAAEAARELAAGGG